MNRWRARHRFDHLHRGGLPDGVPPGGRHPGGLRGRHRVGRGPRAGRAASTRCASGPREGTPRNPGAWLTTVGQAQGGRPLPPQPRPDPEVRPARAGARVWRWRGPPTTTSASIPSRRRRSPTTSLRLMFVSCHPVLAVPARTALTLRLVGGLTVPEIARAYVVPEPTIAQRIVRAKTDDRRGGGALRGPARGGSVDPARVGAPGDLPRSSTRGTPPPPGEDWLRPELCAEALRLGRVLAALDARRARGPRPRGADGVPVVPPAGAHRSDGRARPAPRSRTAAPGTACTSTGARAPWPTAEALGEPAGPTRCRRPSRPATPARFRPEDTDWDERRRALRRTGTRRRRRPSSSSTGPWRSPWRRDRTPR